MTQLPTITDRLVGAAEESARNREVVAGRVANPFDQLYFTEDGKPTFEKPNTGFFGAIGANIFLSQEATDSLGFGGQAVLRSGAEMFSDFNDGGLRAPIARVGDSLILNGENIPFSQATAKQAFQTLSPATQLTLEMNGYGEENLLFLGIKTAEDLETRWSSIVQGTRARQALESFNENAGGLARAGVVVGDFVTNIVTDPIAIAGVVLTAGTTTAAREGAKQTARATLRNYLTDGVVRSVVARTGLAEKRAASRLLFWGSGAAYAGGMNIGYQAGQQQYDIENGLREASEGISVDPIQAGIAGIVGGFFGEVGFRSAGLAPKPVTRESYRAFTDVDDFASHMMSRDERLGFRSKDELIRDIDIEAYETIEEFAKNTLNTKQFRNLVDTLAADEEVGEINIPNLAAFMLLLPDGDELNRFLANKGEIVPGTKFSKLTTEVRELEPKARDAEARGYKDTAKSLRRKLNTLVNERQLHIENNLNITKDNDTPVAQIVQEIAGQIPIAANNTSSGRIARIQQISDEGLRKASEQTRVRTITPAMMDVLNKTGGAILNPLQRTRMAMHSDDDTERYISLMHSLIDHTGFDHTEMAVNAKGVRILSVNDRVREFEQTKMHDIRREFNKVTRGFTEEQNQELGFMVMRALDTGTVGDLPKEYQKLARLYKKGMEDLGTRGVRSGYLGHKLDNFVAFNYNRQADYAMDTFVDQFLNHYRQPFDPDIPSSQVNYNALERMGYARRDGSVHVPKGDVFDDLPKRVSEIPDDLMDDYREALEESLIKDGEAAFTRLTGHHERLSVDPDDPQIRQNKRLRPNNQNARRIEQSFYLTDEMRGSGLVDYDLMKSVDSYFRTTGYNILRDEALGEFYGQPVRYTEWTRAMKNLAQNNKGAQDALDRLMATDIVQAGRFRVNDDGAVLAATLQNVVSSIVSAGITPTIGSVELSGAILRNVVTPKTVTDYVASIGESLKAMRTDDAKTLGLLFEGETNRFTGSAAEFTGESARDSLLVRGTASLNRASRIISGERFWTTASKAIHLTTSYSKLYRRRKKLDKLRGLSRRFDDMKDLKGSARAAGIDPDELLRLRSFGIFDDDMLDIAEKLTEIDPKALRDRTKLNKAAGDLDTDDLKKAAELDRRLTRMAADDAESFVATPTANSKVTFDSPIVNMLTQFTSFGRTFQNRMYARAAMAPYHRQAGGFSFLVAAEITNSVIRDLLYNGHSLETIQESWEDDPKKNLALVLTRLPLWNPMNPVPLIAAGMAGGQQFGLGNLTGAPALSMTSRALGAMQQTGKALLEGDEIPESAVRTFNRVMPGNNFWFTRMINEGIEGFQEDDDR